ncbi:fatty acid desaturase family protein [Cellulomonas sp. Marseille-Q8402]
MTTAPLVTRARRGQEAATGSYQALSAQIREAGLLERTVGYYVGLLVAAGLALAALAVAFVLLGDSWWQLAVAAGLGLVLTQCAFLAHEALHRQVLRSGPANDRLGRVLANGVVGVSHTWWATKHNRHHANPNRVGKDPDIDMEALAFTPDVAATRTGLRAAFARVQGWAFFPLLLLEGLNLHVTSIRSTLARGDGRRQRERTVELVVMALRLGLYLAVVLWFLPIGLALAFLGVQLAVFGVYMGASFAPNHKGMAIIPADSKLDFLSKQVLTSRNISGGTPMSLLLGGLNYQIEHHLFPNMPRPHLSRARELVRAHCAEHGVPYTETTLLTSYGIVVRYLNEVGLAARDPFDCPVAQRYRGR